ncbi:MAG: glycerophosphodiester phosphodiesterase [Arachnia propionica]|nr:MAG: glycerophosphodiester phosphodiesterase [Arachnia propionica]
MPTASRFLEPRFIALAHRGGARLPANLGIENTITAFENAVKLGYRYLETDVHATKDGHVVAFHDTVLWRMTETPGKLADLTLAEIKRLRVGGRESIATFAELLEAFPTANFNVDLKADDVVAPFAAEIKRHGAQHRVCVGSFATARIRRFRKLLPEVATAVSTRGVAVLPTCCVPITRARGDVFQVPMTATVGGIPIRLVTPQIVKTVHRANRKIHVWTIDNPEVMHELIDWGVDGIFTDRPDLLRDVLQSRGMWSTRQGT